MVRCDITFMNSPFGVFYAGQILEGQITLTLDKPIKIRSVFVLIRGQAKCHWTETRRSNNRTHTDHFRNEVDYLSSLTYLTGNQYSDAFELPTGIHNYTIGCALPAQIPSSFEGSYGSIRYSVKVVVDRPWKIDDTFKQAFTVLRPYDLNYDLTTKIPVQQEKIKSFCTWSCGSPPFILNCKLPQSGFVPGQNIPIVVESKNQSGTEIEYLKYSLKKIITYHASTPRHKTKVIKEHVAYASGDQSIPAIGDASIVYHLKVPAVPPTLNDCNVITITYQLKVTAVSIGCHSNPEIHIPITIGTVPIYTQLAGEQYRPDDPNIKPPSFEECISGKQSIVDDDDGQINSTPFAPMYPVYKFDVNAAPPLGLNANSVMGAFPPQLSPGYPSNSVPYPVASGSNLAPYSPGAPSIPYSSDQKASPYPNVPAPPYPGGPAQSFGFVGYPPAPSAPSFSSNETEPFLANPSAPSAPDSSTIEKK